MLIAGDRERLTGTTVAVPITAALLVPVAGNYLNNKAQKAIVQVITGPVFMARNGATPSASVGEVYETGDLLAVHQLPNLQNLRFAHATITWVVEVAVFYQV